jgi:hypothetical protein
MVTRRARDARPRSKKDARQNDENSSDSGGDSSPFRLVLVRHDRLSFSSLHAVTCKPLNNHGCLKFCKFSRTSHISPPTAFPMVHLALHSMFACTILYLVYLEALPAGGKATKRGMQ